MSKKPAAFRLLAKKTVSNQEGYILIMGLLVFIVLIILGIALAVLGLQEVDITARVKLMDQAYLIADGGVNAAAVMLQTNDAYRQASTPVYPNSPGICAGTSSFGGGAYTFTVYQNENYPTDPNYKVIKSRGIITKGDKRVERTILTRVVLGAGGEEYDASFDFLMYNGMDSNGDGVSEKGTWAPTDLRFNSIIGGDFGFDGASEYLGHYPKGAFYADGSINLPTSVAGDLNIKGRVVATDDIYLRNSWGIHTGGNGIKIAGSAQVPGNVVAGVDGSGSATVSAQATGGFASAINISGGNVCAADNVTVNSLANASFSNPMVIGGIRAGKKATIDANFSIGKPLQVTTSGIMSGEETVIESNGFSGVSVAGNIAAGGESNVAIFAGANAGNVGVSLFTNAASNINAGNVRSKGRVDLLAQYEYSNITVGRITAGNDQASATGGTGVDAKINSLLGWLKEPSMNINGRITSAGRVNLTSQCTAGWIKSRCSMTTQGIKSGKDASGWGIVMGGNVYGDYTINGNLESVGSITMNNTDGGKFSSQGIWTGGHLTIGNAADWLSDVGEAPVTITGNAGYPSLRVRGNSDIRSADDIKISGSDMYCLGNFYMRALAPGWLSGDCKIRLGEGNTLYGGGAVQVRNDNSLLDCRSYTGNIYSVGSITFNANDPATTGTFYTLGSLDYRCDSSFTGGDTKAGNMWSTGLMYVKHSQTFLSGDMSMGWAKSATRIEMKPNEDFLNVDISTGGMTAPSISADSVRVSGGKTTADPGNPPGVSSPVVDTPSQPAKPAAPVVASANDATGGDINMLREAGLSAPIKLLRPNWAYFETLAVQNDVANGPETKICPNSNCRRTVNSTNPGSFPPQFPGACPHCGAGLAGVSPGPAHMIYDGGPGDQDGVTNGTIVFKWDQTTPYSSNEIAYNPEPNVNIAISVLNWSADASTFTGTIVSRGNVYITAPSSDWVVKGDQTLNVVSGWDIVNSSSGIALVKQDNAHLHLWAQHDIKLEDMNINLIGVKSFYGSFTAGNRVVFNSNSIWDQVEFKWSRWALDPVAWAPPFKVLEWKEL